MPSPEYVSIKYTERLAEAGIEPSVGSVGDSYDNAFPSLVSSNVDVANRKYDAAATNHVA